jgi:ATP-dependent DNA ligase
MNVREPQSAEVARWMMEDGPIAGVRQARIGIGARETSKEYLNELLGLTPSVSFAIRAHLDERPDAAPDSLDSIPFYSLCKGFFLPLMGIAPERVAGLFGLIPSPALAQDQKAALVQELLDRPLGLSLSEKAGLVLGDPFSGRSPSVRHDTLCQVLAQLVFLPISTVREQLIKAGDLPSLFALSTPLRKADPPVATSVVMKSLINLREARLRDRFEVLLDLFARCGRLERYVLAGLILGKVHLTVGGRQEALLESLSRQYGANLEHLGSAAALLDIFGLCDLLETEGLEGLKSVTLKPLSPIRPALAGTTIPKDLRFPAWFECKYDGLRLMVHKETDPQGRVLCGAFTRRRNDWLELIKGVQNLAQMLPCSSVILDGELHGTILDMTGVPRPATVYEVHSFLRGESPTPVNLKYVAFDIVYLNGHDLTQQPFQTRRRNLETLIGPLVGMPLPLPVVLSQGSRVENKEQMNRLYEQYRRQGHEGGMVKVETSNYPIAQRTMSWMKRKPEETLDLVLTAAFWSDPTSAGKRPFDSYAISCRTPEGFLEVGTVAGVDSATSMRVAQTIMSQGLMTGRPVEHRGHRRTAAGVELAPGLVVSVLFEGIVRPDPERLALRSPRIARLRVGEIGPYEANTLQDLQQMQMKQGLG